MEDKEILEGLKHGSEKAMTLMYRKYYVFLCSIAHLQLNDSNSARDLVQELMIDVWNRRNKIEIKESLKSYLARAITYKIYRANKSIIPLADFDKYTSAQSVSINLEGEELQGIVNKAIDAMPERPRECFLLSRNEELTYKEIGYKLNISPKTVDHHISKALKILKEKINSYLKD